MQVCIDFCGAIFLHSPFKERCLFLAKNTNAVLVSIFCCTLAHLEDKYKIEKTPITTLLTKHQESESVTRKILKNKLEMHERQCMASVQNIFIINKKQADGGHVLTVSFSKPWQKASFRRQSKLAQPSQFSSPVCKLDYLYMNTFQFFYIYSKHHWNNETPPWRKPCHEPLDATIGQCLDHCSWQPCLWVWHLRA